MPQISIPDTDRFSIPIPPLRVQEEIVRILDALTEHSTELQKELQKELVARLTQYEYYRNQLLGYDQHNPNKLYHWKGQPYQVEWKTLGEVAEIKRGKRVVRKQLSESGGYPVFQNSMTPLGYCHDFNVPGDTTYIIAAGAAGEIGYRSDKFWAADDVYFSAVSSLIRSKYLFYYLEAQEVYLKGRVRKASIPRLSRTSFENIPIPLPPLWVQEEIVGVLDRFDALVHSVEQGLPREIELRAQQYAYYREQLLCFPLAAPAN